MKKLNIVTALTLLLLLLMACNKNKEPTVKTCVFVYSSWSSCSMNLQKRTYTSSPSGCSGTPPGDSIQRPCVIPCVFVYSSWSACSNNLQSRGYNSSPSGCTSTPPADSIQRSCTPCVYVYSSWSSCLNNFQTRTYSSSPSGCTSTPPADSIKRVCPTEFIIGSQIWKTTNLDVANYRNGDPIPQVQDATAWSNLSTGAWCYYLNQTAIGTTYGKLYNWFAVNDPRGLAPYGYHIPTDEEWTTLTDYYLGGSFGAGGMMKETGTSHWNYPNSSATNSSGFTGLPGGYRGAAGDFNDLRAYGYWWSSSAPNVSDAWCRYLNYNNDNVIRSNRYKENGYSVRCLKN